MSDQVDLFDLDGRPADPHTEEFYRAYLAEKTRLKRLETGNARIECLSWALSGAYWGLVGWWLCCAIRPDGSIATARLRKDEYPAWARGQIGCDGAKVETSAPGDPTFIGRQRFSEFPGCAEVPA